MKEPLWVGREECLVIHEMMLARHGGSIGLRDEVLLQSALAKPRERFASGGADLAELGACYTAAMVLTRPFVSGNACTGFILAVTFLRANGLVFTGRDVPVVQLTFALAAGETAESYDAKFLQCNSRLP